MIRLPASLKAWGSADFSSVLKDEIGRLDASCLPLQQGLTSTSYALDGTHSAMLLSVTERPDCLQARVGIFYSGIIFLVVVVGGFVRRQARRSRRVV